MRRFATTALLSLALVSLNAGAALAQTGSTQSDGLTNVAAAGGAAGGGATASTGANIAFAMTVFAVLFCVGLLTLVVTRRWAGRAEAN